MRSRPVPYRKLVPRLGFGWRSPAGAAVYKLVDRFLVHGQLSPDHQIPVAIEPFVQLPLDATSEQVGEASLFALDTTNPIIPQPSEWEALSQALLEAAGCRSWERFHDTATLCQVCRDAEAISLIPTINTPEGFEEIDGSAVSLDLDVAVDSLGRQIPLSLEKCKGAPG